MSDGIGAQERERHTDVNELGPRVGLGLVLENLPHPALRLLEIEDRWEQAFLQAAGVTVPEDR